MFLQARMLTSVSGVNDFDYATEVRMTKGNALNVYFQLIDAEKNPGSAGFNPSGLRYMPASGATMVVQFTSIDDSKVITRAATNPFPEDTSIWRVSVLSTDGLSGTVSLKLTLTEGVVVTTAFVKAAIAVSTFGEAC